MDRSTTFRVSLAIYSQRSASQPASTVGEGPQSVMHPEAIPTAGSTRGSTNGTEEAARATTNVMHGETAFPGPDAWKGAQRDGVGYED